MISSGRAVVGPDGLLRSVHSRPPMTIRQVLSDDPGRCALCLVGSAAGPLAGDDVRFDLTLEADAAATLTSVGALIAQGRGAGAASALHTRVVLGARAEVNAAPQPVVVCAGSRVALTVSIELDPTASVRWREILVLGRSDESAGAVSVEWDVRRGGRPLLRQRLDLTGAETWAGLLRGHRVLATELHAGPRVHAQTVVRSDRAVVLRVDDHCELLTVLADDTAGALSELARLSASSGLAPREPVPAGGPSPRAAE